MSSQPALALAIDEQTRAAQLKRVGSWLTVTVLLQGTYRRLTARAQQRVDEPHIRAYLTDLHDVARQHENQIAELRRAFGCPPGSSVMIRPGSVLLAQTKAVVGHLQGRIAGAAAGEWRLLRQLMLSNQDALGAYGVTEQLGLALGLPGVIDLTLPIVRRKQQDQLLIQEYLLEMAPNAILLSKGM
jgi:hypothetical protein